MASPSQPSVYWIRDTSGDVAVAIDASAGGDISSICWKGRELLFKGLKSEDTFEPESWQGRGHWLFPAVGRQRDGRYSFGDATYDMPLHGWLRHLPLHLVTPTGSEDTLRLSLSSASLPTELSSSYPFPFELLLSFAVREGRLDVSTRVTNTGAEGLLPVALGSHLTFKFPFSDSPADGTGGGSTPLTLWEQGVLRSSCCCELELAPGSLLSGRYLHHAQLCGGSCNMSMTRSCSGSGSSSTSTTGKAAAVAAGLSLRNPLACNAVLGHPSCCRDNVKEAADADVVASLAEASLGATAEPLFITLAQPGVLAVTVTQHPVHILTGPVTGPLTGPVTGETETLRESLQEVNAHRHFVLWGHPPQEASATAASATSAATAATIVGKQHCSSFLCLEPWLSGPDSLNTRKGLPILQPGQSVLWSFSVHVEEA